MDTEHLAALNDTDSNIGESLSNAQIFSPPSLSASQLKQLELLQHLSLYSEMLIVVCAEKGMGKTFLANALLAARETPDQSLMLEADFSLSYLDTLHHLAQFLDLANLVDDIDSIEQQVLAQCVSVSEDDQGSILLIIDQAEQLSDDVLQDINQLALLAPNALHIMLLAPLGFENKLLALAEPQAPFHVMEVEPLADDEAEILLLEHFPEKHWEAEQVDYIIQQSTGNPGKILYLAQQVISGGAGLQQQESKFPITHVAAIGLVAFALIGTYFYQNNAIEANNEALLEVEAIATIEPTPVLASPIEQNAGGSADKSADDSIETTAAPNDGSLEAVAPAEEVDFNFPADSATLSSTAQSTAQVKDPVKAAVKPAAKPKASYSKDEQALMSAANSAFVIQLFGSYSADSADTFMTTHASKAIDLYRYQGEYKSKPWHVVLAGPFESKAIALQQAKQLPAKLRNQNPWVRPVADIQTILSNR